MSDGLWMDNGKEYGRKNLGLVSGMIGWVFGVRRLVVAEHLKSIE